MSKTKVEFKPFDMLVNALGFVLGFLLTDFLVPIINAVVEFMSLGGQFPVQSIFGPVSNMSGPMALMIIGIIGILVIKLAKKFMGFILWLLVGLFLHGLLLVAGIPIPSLFDWVKDLFNMA